MNNDKQLIYEQYLAVTENTRQNPVVDRRGNKHWYNENNKLHREDGPAAEYADGTKRWYINGKFHREDGPAVEWTNGSKFWYIDNKLHREDGPAVEWADGSKAWYINNKSYNTIPKWAKALFDYKGWTPEFLASKGKDYDKLVNIYAQKMIDKYE